MRCSARRSPKSASRRKRKRNSDVSERKLLAQRSADRSRSSGRCAGSGSGQQRSGETKRPERGLAEQRGAGGGRGYVTATRLRARAGNRSARTGETRGAAGDNGRPERNSSSIPDSGPDAHADTETEAHRAAVDASKSFSNAEPETDS